MSTIDETGLDIDSFDDTKTAFNDDLKSTFGENTKTSDESVFGQISNIVSERISDQNELIEVMANMFNPQAAIGVFQSQLVKLNGLERKEPAYSTVSVDVTANVAGSSIPAGSTVSDPLSGEKFALDAAVTLAPGETKSVSATALNLGSIEAASGTLTKIENPEYGWESVTNPADASLGALEESSTDLRIRRDIASRRTGNANVSAIFSALAEIDEVDFLQVYDHRTSSIPAGYIWAVVSGGSDQDIAAVLHNIVPAGTLMFGDVVIPYNDPITGQVYDQTLSRPTEINIYTTFELEKYSSYPANGDDLIVANTVKFFEGNFYLNETLIEPFKLGEDVVASRLYTPANSVQGHRIVGVKIGTSPSPTTSDNVAIAPDEIAGVTTSTIVVTTVI